MKLGERSIRSKIEEVKVSTMPDHHTNITDIAVYSQWEG